MHSRTHLLVVLSLIALPACNDMLDIYPPADELLDGGVAMRVDNIETHEDAGAD